MSELSPTSHNLAKKPKQKRPNPQQRRRREAYRLARIAAELEAPGGLKSVLNATGTTAATATAVEECLREQTSSVRSAVGMNQHKVVKKIKESAAEHDGAEAARGSAVTASAVTTTAYGAPTGAEVLLTAETGGSVPTSVPNRKIRRLRERAMKAGRGARRNTCDADLEPGAAGANLASCSSGRKKQTSGEAHAARRARLRKPSSVKAKALEAVTMLPKLEREECEAQQELNANSLWEAFLKADGHTQSLVCEHLQLRSTGEKKAEGQRMTLPNTTTGETGAKKPSNPGSKVQATANSSLEMRWRAESPIADKETAGKRSASEKIPKSAEPRPPAAPAQLAPHLRARLASDPRSPVVETSCHLRKKVIEYITAVEDLEVAPYLE
ncbi:hypothetical protein BZA05DRAFT_448680 [Tricharina praecox]|uniref:uncharacterized protein n=1 Tax=Tricharina praecox TaxID=43433 RepID=UPI00221EB344|nr:uncharacterized protein BZA05DRAFT_448680 [Tricharina praecox]KAI5843772.1 hypothetical protein BZA05DRAFT_448680 [Tricharina praecox]